MTASGRNPAKDRVAIVGLGRSPYSRDRGDCTPGSLVIEAAINAIRDTGLGADDVDGIWYHAADGAGSTEVERPSTGNMKRTWVSDGKHRDWWSREQGEGREFLREATQIKNIWVPYGE